jgi:hypothetical protein
MHPWHVIAVLELGKTVHDRNPRIGRRQQPNYRTQRHCQERNTACRLHQCSLNSAGQCKYMPDLALTALTRHASSGNKKTRAQRAYRNPNEETEVKSSNLVILEVQYFLTSPSTLSSDTPQPERNEKPTCHQTFDGQASAYHCQLLQ